jgi:tetratricopeptide (TPR) repeat protein
MRRDRDRIIARALVRRGNDLRDMQRGEEALADYKRALELRPDDAFAYTNRGWLYEKQGHLDLARLDYEKAAALLQPPDDWLRRALERTR